MPGTAPSPRSPLTLPLSASVQRIRDKYDTELSELEQSERTLQQRCAELKGRLGEAEGESVRLQGLVRQKEKELAHLTAVSRVGGAVGCPSPPPTHSHPVPAQVNEQLVSERSGLAEVLRQEFADRLAASDEETRQVRAELAELRARQRLELERLTREKQADLEEVHGRWAGAGAGAWGEVGGMLDLRKGRGCGRPHSACRAGPSAAAGAPCGAWPWGLAG